MIKKLRRKFILIAMSSTFLMLTIIVGIINITNYSHIYERADQVLTYHAENNFDVKSAPDDTNIPGGKKQIEISKDNTYLNNYFTVTIDDSNNITNIDVSKTRDTTSDEAEALAEQALTNGNDLGWIDQYRYKLVTTQNGNILVFVNCSQELDVFYNFLTTSIFVSLLGLLGVFIFVLIFSKSAIKPVAESYEKQKRFITDVSHELKTPLAIINTNVEVLEMDYGDNKWSSNIKNQVSRLNELVQSLVSLTRMDEDETTISRNNFSISDALLDTVNSFEVVAKKFNYSLDVDVDSNVSYYGDESLIRQLFSILIDNAIKYNVNDKPIKITLKLQGEHIHITTINNAENIKIGNNDIIFDRFYRGDSSRNSKTGGYGIGLSIGKAIVKKHRGKIKASSEDGKLLKIEIIL